MAHDELNMGKIDNSTYKEIKKDKKLQKDTRYGKGKYGHSKHYRNNRLMMTLAILVVIILDVAFSVILFHTRKTVFVIVGCIMAIPFARNLIDFIMSLRAKPLGKEEYEKTCVLAKESGRKLLYDVSITEEDGVIYIPCLLVYNNNIICYTPHISGVKDRDRVKKYVSGVNYDEHNYRIFVTEKYSTFEKEVKKIGDASNETLDIDQEIIYRLLSMGF